LHDTSGGVTVTPALAVAGFYAAALVGMAFPASCCSIAGFVYSAYDCAAPVRPETSGGPAEAAATELNSSDTELAGRRADCTAADAGFGVADGPAVGAARSDALEGLTATLEMPHGTR
jgi:hypothetical protein